MWQGALGARPIALLGRTLLGHTLKIHAQTQKTSGHRFGQPFVGKLPSIGHEAIGVRSSLSSRPTWLKPKER
jgi:hypothetical protein